MQEYNRLYSQIDPGQQSPSGSVGGSWVDSPSTDDYYRRMGIPTISQPRPSDPLGWVARTFFPNMYGIYTGDPKQRTFADLVPELAWLVPGEKLTTMAEKALPKMGRALNPTKAKESLLAGKEMGVMGIEHSAHHLEDAAQGNPTMSSWVAAMLR